MFIDVVPDGRSAPAVLLRESCREGKRVPLDGGSVVGRPVVGRPEGALEIRRALPHGHVSAVLASMECPGSN